MSQPPTQPPPYQPPAASPGSDDRLWAAAAHVGALVSAWFAFGFIGPLVVLVVWGERSPFVRRHAVESLNFQLTLLLLAVLAVVVTLLTVGVALIVLVPIGLVVLVIALIAVIAATLAAQRGEDYRYPLSIRFVR